MALVTKFPHSAEPWRVYTLKDAKKELAKAKRHLVGYGEGEVAVVWYEWDEIGAGTQAVGDFPPQRDAKLWHPQFARTRAQAEKTRRLRQRSGEVVGDVDLRTVGDTTILRWHAGDGHERLRAAPWRSPCFGNNSARSCPIGNCCIAT